jgi:hypothetical protein
VFDLLGHKENDITASIGWGLARCECFLKQFLTKSLPSVPQTVQRIELQKHGEDNGFTDIEIIADEFHLIVEAKCGWTLPELRQLERYANRFSSAQTHTVLIVLSACSQHYVTKHRLPDKVSGVTVKYLSYDELTLIIKRSATLSSYSDRRILMDLKQYLEAIMQRDVQGSNMVYVVALAAGTPHFSSISWIDIVEKRHRYFHPLGTKGWPTEPPTYVGFRYGGRLQFICHVDSYVVALDGSSMAAEIPEINANAWDKSPNVTPGAHFIYKLGSPVRPPHIVKSGNVRAARLRADIDLLLTSRSVTEAVEMTKRRLSRD